MRKHGEKKLTEKPKIEMDEEISSTEKPVDRKAWKSNNSGDTK